MNHEETKNVYRMIFDIIESYGDNIVLPTDALMEIAEKHLKSIEYKEECGIEINYRCIESDEYTRINENAYLWRFGGKRDNVFHFSGDIARPCAGELFLYLTFPCGEYHFGDDCPPEMFTDFFKELLNLGPRYVDHKNGDLLFSAKDAAEAYAEYHRIHKMYLENREWYIKMDEVKRLKKELIWAVRSLTK